MLTIAILTGTLMFSPSPNAGYLQHAALDDGDKIELLLNLWPWGTTLKFAKIVGQALRGARAATVRKTANIAKAAKAVKTSRRATAASPRRGKGLAESNMRSSAGLVSNRRKAPRRYADKEGWAAVEPIGPSVRDIWSIGVRIAKEKLVTEGYDFVAREVGFRGATTEMEITCDLVMRRESQFYCVAVKNGTQAHFTRRQRYYHRLASNAGSFVGEVAKVMGLASPDPKTVQMRQICYADGIPKATRPCSPDEVLGGELAFGAR
jgi:hypothetical protein